MQEITQKQFRHFKDYMRRMIDDISHATTGAYHNAPHMQELAVVWNEGDKPKLEGYPMPENLTHIPHEPHLNHVEGGEYPFKRAMERIMLAAGYEAGEDMFISGFGPGRFDCKMYSSMQETGEHEFASRIDCFFIRVNGDLGPAQEFMQAMDERQLDRVCRAALEDKNVSIEKPRPKHRANSLRM